MPDQAEPDPAPRRGLLIRVLGLVAILALVYLAAFLLWRAQLTSLDDIAIDLGASEKGIPDWIDGGHQVLVIDADRTLDRAGATIFAPLVALEEAMSDVNYIESDEWKIWRD